MPWEIMCYTLMKQNISTFYLTLYMIIQRYASLNGVASRGLMQFIPALLFLLQNSASNGLMSHILLIIFSLKFLKHNVL
jgi:hypothetical protein